MRRRISLFIIFSISGLVLLAVLGFWWFARNDAILIALLGVVGPIILSMVRRGLEERDSDSTLDARAARLAGKVRTYWNIESDRRNQRSVPSVPAHWERIETGHPGPRLLPEGGGLNDLITSYQEQPFRLVLLGDAGSGKTVFCMHLTLALLGTDTPTRIPVLLQLASWDRRKDFMLWMTEQVQTLHGIDRATTKDLLTAGRILPILDGADEGLDSSVPATLHALNAIPELSGPIVVTCREGDFNPRNDPLDRDVDVRILPLRSGDIADTLARASSGQQRWTPVIDNIRNNPQGIFAEALSTNLMMYLMLQVYKVSDETPADLIDQSRYRTSSDIQDKLIELFLTRAFRDEPWLRDVSDERRARWLEFMASRLRNEADKRLSWWQFYRAFGAGWFTLVRTIVGALTIGTLLLILFGLFGRPLLGVLFGATLGAIGGLALGLPQPAEPRNLPFVLRRNKEGRKPAIILGVVSGIGAVIAIGLVQRSIVLGISSGLVIGPGFAAARQMLARTSPRPTGVMSPDEVLRDDRRAVLTSFLLGGLICAAVGAGIGVVSDSQLLGFVIPLTGQVEHAIAGAVIGALMGSFGLAIMVHGTSAWGRLVLIRVLLAARRRMPWRIMRFLRDCERVGVLRRLGPQYEFRNELFRAWLAASAQRRLRPEA